MNSSNTSIWENSEIMDNSYESLERRSEFGLGSVKYSEKDFLPKSTELVSVKILLPVLAVNVPSDTTYLILLIRTLARHLIR
jgi:hypothetical protein